MKSQKLLCSLFVSITIVFATPVEYKKPSKPYDFSYGIQSGDYYDPNFHRKEHSDGHTVKGSYSIDLPDGRKQTVRYEADHETGFVADVSYLGVAKYPPHNKRKPFIVHTKHHQVPQESYRPRPEKPPVSYLPVHSPPKRPIVFEEERFHISKPPKNLHKRPQYPPYTPHYFQEQPKRRPIHSPPPIVHKRPKPDKIHESTRPLFDLDEVYKPSKIHGPPKHSGAPLLSAAQQFHSPRPENFLAAGGPEAFIEIAEDVNDVAGVIQDTLDNERFPSGFQGFPEQFLPQGPEIERPQFFEEEIVADVSSVEDLNPDILTMPIFNSDIAQGDPNRIPFGDNRDRIPALNRPRLSELAVETEQQFLGRPIQSNPEEDRFFPEEFQQNNEFNIQGEPIPLEFEGGGALLSEFDVFQLESLGRTMDTIGELQEEAEAFLTDDIPQGRSHVSEEEEEDTTDQPEPIEGEKVFEDTSVHEYSEEDKAIVQEEITEVVPEEITEVISEESKMEEIEHSFGDKVEHPNQQ